MLERPDNLQHGTTLDQPSMAYWTSLPARGAVERRHMVGVAIRGPGAQTWPPAVTSEESGEIFS